MDTNTYIHKIRVKERIFHLKEMSKLKAYVILKVKLKGAVYNSKDKLWDIPNTVANMKFLQDYVYEDEYRQWFSKIFSDYLKKKKEHIQNKSQENSSRKEQLKQQYEELKNKYPYLYDFQLKAVLKACNTNYKGFLISLDPGLGKTVTSLIIAKEKNHKNVWIVCPASLQNQWKIEIKKWLNEDDVQIYTGTKLKKERMYKENHKFNIISYETLRNDVQKNDDLKNNIRNSLFIADESSKLKNHKSQLYKAVQKITRFVEYQLYLTGTPLTNNLFDMNNTINLIDRNLIKNVNDYCKYEQRTIGWGANAKVFNELVGYKNLEEYGKKIQPVYKRKSKQDVSNQLPSRNVIQYSIEQHAFCHDVKEVIADNIGNFSGFSLLQMLECGYPVFDSSESESSEQVKLTYNKIPKDIEKQIKYEQQPEKIKTLVQLLEQIDEKVIIFTHYIESSKMVYNWLIKLFKNKKIKCTLNQDKNQLKEEFVNGNVDIVVATDTWSHGISLSNINYLINYDIVPSLETYLQRNERIYRIDSKEAKFVYNLVGDIVENHVMKILLDKMELFEKVVDGKAGEVKDLDIKKQVIEKLMGK